MITFDGFGPVTEHAARCRDAVPPGVYDLVDTTALHLTIGRVGFTDELPESRAREVVAAASLAVAPPGFVLSFGPLTGSRGAIRFSVGPWTPLLSVHAFLAGETRAVLAEQCVMDTAAFRPHVSIAYAQNRLPAAAVVERLVEWRGVPGPEVPIETPALVRLQRIDRSYRYETLARIALSGPS